MLKDQDDYVITEIDFKNTPCPSFRRHELLFTRTDLIQGSPSTMKVYYLQVGVELDGGKYCGTLNPPLRGDSCKLYDKTRFSFKYLFNSIFLQYFTRYPLRSSFSLIYFFYSSEHFPFISIILFFSFFPPFPILHTFRLLHCPLFCSLH